MSSTNQISHLFVVRRALDGRITELIGSRGHLAHSAVLLRDQTGSHQLLEYMGDSKTHLNPVEFVVTETNHSRSFQIIDMPGATLGGGLRMFEWEKQLLGKELAGGNTGESLREKMESLMAASVYSTTSHNCHDAQEKLRDWLGLL